MTTIAKTIITPASITLVLSTGGKSKTITVKSTDDRFPVIKRYLKDDNSSGIVELLDTSGKVAKLTEGKIKKGADGALFIGDDEMPTELSDKIKQLAASDYDPTPFVEFWRRLKLNPSEHSRKQFYEFIKNCDCNITADGHVIVYKGVTKDLRSKHSPTHRCKDGRVIDMLHTPGTYLEIPREDAADNPSVACSFGLHCAPWVHVKNHYDNYGTKVELLLDPKDVVSVPHDGRGEKIRVCRYKILREMKAGDEPLKDVLAKMKRKTTAEGKELREKAAKLTKVALDFDGGNLVVPPDVMIAAGIEPKDKAQVYVMQGYAIIGKVADTEVLAKQVQRNVGKFDGAKAVPAAISPRCSISIEGALLRNMTKDGSTFAQYEAEITSLNKRKIIRLTAIESAGLTKQSAKLKEVKKAGVKEKATRKVEKKTAKKATKKKAAKKAAKKTAKK